MRGQAKYGQSLLVRGPKPRGAVRAIRRVAVIVTLVMALGVVVPAGALPPDRSGTSLSWLWNWLSVRPSWAFGDPSVPKQQRGKNAIAGHYVSSPRFVDPGEAKKAKGELPRYEPHRPQVGKVKADTGRVGFKAATSERIPSAAGQKWDVYRNADGSYTRRVHLDSTNYRAADGSWQPIDSNLRMDSAGRPRVTANSFALTFAAGSVGSVAAVPASADRAVVPEDLVRLTVEPGGSRPREWCKRRPSRDPV